MKIKQFKNGNSYTCTEEELYFVPVTNEQIYLAKKELRRARRRGFKYCEATFFDGKFEGLRERAHPTDGNLDWGVGQDVTRRNYFFFDRIIKDPFYRFTKHAKNHPRMSPKKQWKAFGLDCLVSKNERVGCWCGYVRIPIFHPFWKKNEGQILKPNCSDFEGSICGIIDVHGGVTFSGKMKANNLFSGWWIGFDCGHAGDALEGDSVNKFRKMFGDDFMNHGDHHWTLEEVVAETEKMAKQVKEYKQ